LPGGASRWPTRAPLLFPQDAGIVGLATDAAVETTLPTAHLDDIPAVAVMMHRFATGIADVLAQSTVAT
jgi:molybdopterin-guanine dinucleotide biosynthesis protein B